MSKKRKYDDSYIKWGFMKFVKKDGTKRPQCVLCYKVLAEASMKPSKLKAHLASNHPVFVRYLTGFAVKEEFLFCSPKATTKSEDIMNIVNHFMEENGLRGDTARSLCTDGAPAMMGAIRIRCAGEKKCPDVIVTHCVLHRHALATKTLPKELGDLMAIAVATVNFIRARALHHRLFQVFCEDIGAAYTYLLYYTEVRWLSRAQVLNRVLQLRQEIEIFLREKGKDLTDYFDDPIFVARLACSATFSATLTLSTFHFNYDRQSSRINQFA